MAVVRYFADDISRPMPRCGKLMNVGKMALMVPVMILNVISENGVWRSEECYFH